MNDQRHVSNCKRPTRTAEVDNAFGIAVPRPATLPDAPAAMQLAKRLLLRTFDSAQSSGQTHSVLIENLFERLMNGCSSEADLEREFRDRAAETKLLAATTSLLNDRAQLIANQARPYVREGRLLDLGCGDALASGILADLGGVVLADIVDYRDASQRQREFHLLREGQQLPFDTGAFDTVLLLTVLHHASHPLVLLKEACRVCHGRIVVIESVFGIKWSTRLRSLPRRRTELRRQAGLRTYLHLSEREQLAYCSFIDWFYNRIVHEDVPVPYNYNSPAGWRKVFRDHGLCEVQFFHLGLDQPMVPEFHTLHVLERGRT